MPRALWITAVGLALALAAPAVANAADDCPNGGTVRFGVEPYDSAARLVPPGAAVQLAPSVVAGCELARGAAERGDRVVVCGSVYAVGPALEWLRIY